MIQEDSNKKGSKANWKKKILNFLENNPSGFTIKDIAEEIKTTRITVSKYLSLLEQEKKVFSKEIGVYKLYFSTERKYIAIDLIRAFYKSLLSGMKEKFSEKEEFKKIGYLISDSMFTFLVEQYPKSLREQITSFKDFLNYFGKMYPYLDFLYSKNLTIEEEINEKEEKGLYRFKNVEILNVSEDFEYHFYIISGIIEKTLSKLFKRKPVICNVESINKEEKIVTISIKRQ